MQKITNTLKIHKYNANRCKYSTSPEQILHIRAGQPFSHVVEVVGLYHGFLQITQIQCRYYIFLQGDFLVGWLVGWWLVSETCWELVVEIQYKYISNQYKYSTNTMQILYNLAGWLFGWLVERSWLVSETCWELVVQIQYKYIANQYKYSTNTMQILYTLAGWLFGWLVGWYQKLVGNWSWT